MRFFNNLKYSALIFSFALLGACGGGETDATSTNTAINKNDTDTDTANNDTASFSGFSLADFSYDSIQLDSSSSSELRDELQNESRLYLTGAPPIPTNSDFDESCFNDKLYATQFNASGSSITLKSQIDFSQCFDFSNANITIVKQSGIVDFLFEYASPDINLAQGNYSLSELENKFKNVSSNTSQITEQMKIVFSLDYKETEQGEIKSRTIENLQYFGGLTNGELTSCNQSDVDRHLTNQCVKYDKTTLNDSGIVSVDYQEYKTQNLSWTNTSDLYFSGGSIDFRVNQWVGSVTYDGNNVPTYSASDGTAQTASGSLLDASQLNVK